MLSANSSPIQVKTQAQVCKPFSPSSALFLCPTNKHLPGCALEKGNPPKVFTRIRPPPKAPGFQPNSSQFVGRTLDEMQFVNFITAFVRGLGSAFGLMSKAGVWGVRWGEVRQTVETATDLQGRGLVLDRWVCFLNVFEGIWYTPCYCTHTSLPGFWVLGDLGV